MHEIRKAVVIGLTVAFVGISTHAQQPAQTQPATAAQAPPAPIFRTNTRLSVQTVTVKDKDGKPIEGLTAKDFVVTEDGESQAVAFVEFQ
ncbi:MAG TPA: hypothetical protein VFP91_06350, partial [Vicinamibacterales bacterium]|nr:hypothetical protein [Vicinamibacterales bacterium]